MMKKSLLIIVFLCVINFFSWQMLFYFKNDNLRVVFFDVGQGDSIFIRTPQKHHILIDGGPGNVVLEKLRRELPFFYNSIDLLILTHSHDDHVSGLIEVLERYDVKEIVSTGALGEATISKKWNKIINEKGYREARAGQKIFTTDFYITTLYPVKSLKEEKVKDLNAISVISLFNFKEKYRFLFMGDVYDDQEKELLLYCEGVNSCDDLAVDVLKIGHHGSKTSTSEVFLKKVMPKVAVIMVGADNRYGHPHYEVIERLEDFNINVMRTDRDGDIVFNLLR
jgi:competence protein ComEC